ncbi:MAG: amidohydrolase [Chlamydiae bacterium]|jgi:amidohydrolase|nr:amidohydrolase [Chlamydiota bacterium]
MLTCKPSFKIQSSLAISSSLESYTISLRRELHKIAEPSWREEKTLALISIELDKISKESIYPTYITTGKGGIWVDLIVDDHLPFILFRSDIDALPIKEETNLSFSSIHDGYMHACGHDCHAAMLLTSFKAIASGLIFPKSNIRFVFQRAEECGENPSGGSILVEEGVLKNIDFVYALHISSTLDSNVFYSRKDLMMANSSYIEFEINCSGGHVMRPDLGSNAISLMTDILTHLKGFEKLFFPPNEPIVFIPSIATAGGKSNIRPNTAYFCYAIRNFLSQAKREEFIHAIEQKVETITKLYPSAKLSNFKVNPGYPALYNNSESYKFVESALREELFQTAPSPILFSGEDFAYYLKETPGSFWLLGAKQSPMHDHHTSKFNPDESTLKTGVAFWLTLAQKAISRPTYHVL